MKRPEEVKLEFTREWVRKAEADFKATGHLLKGGEDYLFGNGVSRTAGSRKIPQTGDITESSTRL